MVGRWRRGFSSCTAHHHDTYHEPYLTPSPPTHSSPWPFLADLFLCFMDNKQCRSSSGGDEEVLSDRFIPSRRSSLMDVAYSLLTASQHHNSPGGGNAGGGAGAQGEANAGNGRNAQPQSLAGAGNSGAAGEGGPFLMIHIYDILYRYGHKSLRHAGGLYSPFRGAHDG